MESIKEVVKTPEELCEALKTLSFEVDMKVEDGFVYLKSFKDFSSFFKAGNYYKLFDVKFGNVIVFTDRPDIGGPLGFGDSQFGIKKTDPVTTHVVEKKKISSKKEVVLPKTEDVPKMVKMDMPVAPEDEEPIPVEVKEPQKEQNKKTEYPLLNKFSQKTEEYLYKLLDPRGTPLLFTNRRILKRLEDIPLGKHIFILSVEIICGSISYREIIESYDEEIAKKVTILVNIVQTLDINSCVVYLIDQPTLSTIYMVMLEDSLNLVTYTEVPSIESITEVHKLYKTLEKIAC